MSTPAVPPGRVPCLRWLLASRGETSDVDASAPDDWLIAHGLAAVAVADPATFEISGPFLARYERGWTVKFGVTSGVIHDPFGAEGGPVLEAQVLTSLALDAETRPAGGHPGRGTVVAIAIADAAGAPMTPLHSVGAVGGVGLRGDRYARGAGTFSHGSPLGRHLTMIESEALDELAERGIELDPIEARRNLVVEGVDLDRLIGRRFRVGEVECLGRRRCEPCAVLQGLTKPGVLRGLVHRGGLRADVLTSGEISVGDEVVALD